MNIVARRALFRRAAVLVAVATPALAQPGAEEMPPPPDGGTVVVIQPEAGQGQASEQPPVRAVVAPYNEDWNNVSHINGQIVKVGERNEYLVKFKKTNIASNPIGWMYGFYGLSVSHAISANIAVRADANLFDLERTEGWEVGLTLPIYFRRVYQGPFFEGGILARRFDDRDDAMATADVGAQVLFGWHWTFDSGANVAFAAGSFRPMNGDKDRDPQFAGYFRIGYAY